LGGNLGLIANIFNNKLFAGDGNSLVIRWIQSHRWLLLLFFFIVSGLLILLVINVRSVNTMLVNKRQLEKEILILKDHNSRLYSKIIELESAERIIPHSETNLNMFLPNDAPKVIYK